MPAAPTLPVRASALDAPDAPRRRARAAALLGGILLLAMSVCACSGDVAGPLPTGTWGGPQGTLVIYADSATLELPCAAARISAPLAAAADGSFDLPGFWAPMAGPIGIGGANWQPARFSGRRDGDTVDLTIVLSSGSTVGPLTLKRGVAGVFPRCV